MTLLNFDFRCWFDSNGFARCESVSNGLVGILLIMDLARGKYERSPVTKVRGDAKYHVKQIKNSINSHKYKFLNNIRRNVSLHK